MKSKLLFTTVVFAGLTGMISAQSQRPGFTVNTPTPEQLTQWMRSSIGSNVATADQWCYAMGQLARGYTCPPPDQFGFAGNERNARVDAQTFLNNLRTYQSGGNTAPFVAGGNRPAEESPGVEACRHAVRDRLRDEGYHDVQIPSTHSEDRPGGADRVYGFAEAQGHHFDFSCAVNLERGDLRSVDVNPR